jgi:hypothetical protein
MRHMHTKAGSPADCVLSAVVMLRQCRDFVDVETAYPRILGYLEFAARRVGWVARQKGSSPAVLAPCKWLDAILRDHAALDSAEGEALRAELRGLVGRIREWA